MQLDYSLRCRHEETLQPWLSKTRPVKNLIRLCECAGWSESSQGAHVLTLRYVSGHFGSYFVKTGDTRKCYHHGTQLCKGNECGLNKGRNIRIRTLGHICPAKIQIRLRIRAIWSESSLGTRWVATMQRCFMRTTKTGDTRECTIKEHSTARTTGKGIMTWNDTIQHFIENKLNKRKETAIKILL